MREMKKTTIPFCEYIPDKWQVLQNRYLFCNHSVKVGENYNEYQLLSLTTSGVKKKDINASGGKVPTSYDNYQTVSNGDMIFCLFDLDCSAVFSGLSSFEGMITSAYDVFKPEEKYVDKHYIEYWFQYVFSYRYYKMYSKSIRYTITSDMFKAITTPVPPIEEQRRIGEYLDSKCTQIDALISNAQQQIEKLKALRDAVLREVLSEGANITGICREQYTTTKMGSIGTYKKGPFGSSLKKSMFVPKGDKTFKVYEQKNAIYKNATLGYYYISEEKFNELKSFEICPGDIIISCAGTIGECYEIPVDAEKGVINQALMYVRLNKDMDTLFFTYLFEFVIKSISLTDSNGSAMKNIPPFDKIKPFIISIPSTKENQHKLAEYIQKKIKTITDLTENKQKKIEKLQQYKKSLIYEYVTGKKEV